MTITINSYLKKGYIPLACNRYAGIAMQGELLNDFWMWNGQYTVYKGGVRHIQTVRVSDLKEAALRYWRDGWVPLKPVEDDLLRRMEAALRVHAGLKKEGVIFPDEQFLKRPEPIPDESLGPEALEYLGRKTARIGALERDGEVPAEIIESYRKAAGGL